MQPLGTPALVLRVKHAQLVHALRLQSCKPDAWSLVIAACSAQRNACACGMSTQRGCRVSATDSLHASAVMHWREGHIKSEAQHCQQAASCTPFGPSLPKHLQAIPTLQRLLQRDRLTLRSRNHFAATGRTDMMPHVKACASSLLYAWLKARQRLEPIATRTLFEARLTLDFVMLDGRRLLAEHHLAAQVVKVWLHIQRHAHVFAEELLRWNLQTRRIVT